MRFLRGGLIAGLSLVSNVIFMPSALATTASAADPDGTPQLLTELLFNSTTPTTSTIARTASTASTQALLPTAQIGAPNWTIGAQNGASLSVQATPGPTGVTVNALEGSYPSSTVTTGAEFMWADYSVASLQTEDIYIEFWARMPGAKGGSKFLKIFGARPTDTNFANTTFNTDYTGIDSGAILQILFGDGTVLSNDGQNAIKLNGSHPDMIGRSYGNAVVQTPQNTGFSSTDWGTGWHHFLIHAKFNSGTTAQNEVPNGEYFLEIDGKVYLDAVGLYNRNPANGPIDHIELFGWAQNDPAPFQVSYYDVKISTGGFMPQGQGLPNPPADVGVNVN
jgi:hypothetical protein